MSIHHRIDLYFPVERLTEAVRQLDTLYDRERTRPFDVELPNGDNVTVYAGTHSPPYTSPTEYANYLSFDSILYFPVDAVVQEYIDMGNATAKEHGFPKAETYVIQRDGKKWFPVGYLEISISASKRYAKISVGVVSSSQNWMIRDSAAVHSVFTHILKASGGVAGLIFVDSRDWIVLTDTSKSIYLHLEPLGDGNDLDAIAEAAISRVAVLG